MSFQLAPLLAKHPHSVIKAEKGEAKAQACEKAC
jgi:hypothetical protein